MSEVAQAPQLRFPEFNVSWNEYKLGSITDVVDSLHTTPKDYVSSGFPMIRVVDVSNIELDLNKCLNVSEETYRQFTKKYQPKVGDVVLSRVGTCGASIMLRTKDNVCLGQNTVLLHPKINKDFYHILVKSNIFQVQVSRRVVGSTQKTLSLKDLKLFKLNIPAKPEQQKIAEFLTAVDNKIEQLSKKQELLSEYKKGLMQKIFSQAIRFKADDGSDFSDWEQVKLATLSKLVTKQTGYDYSSTIKPSLETSKDDSNIPFVQNKDFNSTSINLNTDFYVPVSVQKKYPRITLDEKCLLITISGNIGNVGVYNKQEKAFIGGAVCVAKFKDKDNIDFVKYYLTTDIGQKMMLREVKASSHQNITVEGIRNFRIMLPYLEEQKKIVVFLSIIDNKIEQAGKQLIESKQFKKALLQQMFV